MCRKKGWLRVWYDSAPRLRRDTEELNPRLLISGTAIRMKQGSQDTVFISHSRRPIPTVSGRYSVSCTRLWRVVTNKLIEQQAKGFPWEKCNRDEIRIASSSIYKVYLGDIFTDRSRAEEWRWSRSRIDSRSLWRRETKRIIVICLHFLRLIRFRDIRWCRMMIYVNAYVGGIHNLLYIL